MLSTFNHMVWLQEVAHDAIRRRITDDRGASLVEYALLLALIAMVCIGAITVLGTATGDSVSRTADSVTAAN
jgi:pilus assembly protein Flp/PilA